MAMQKVTTGVGPAIYSPDLCLTMLLEGTMLGVPEVDAEAYRRFRINVDQLVHQMASGLPVENKIELVKAIVAEFDTYRAESENAARRVLTGWRGLVTKLFGKLLQALGIDPHNASAFSLGQRIRLLSTATELVSWDERLEEFLDPRAGGASAANVAGHLHTADTSTANDNLAGLHGGGLALERITALIEQGDRGYVVLFRLGCLDLIYERFGDEAVQDAVMAVSAYLTASLRRSDTIYHWSDSSLLATLEQRANEAILSAELRRIVAMNRDVNISIGGRIVMLRIPIEFDVVPIGRLRSVDDVRKLSLQPPHTH